MMHARPKIPTRSFPFPAPLLAAIATFLMLLPGLAVLASEGSDDGKNPQAIGVQPGPPPELTVLFTGEVMGWTEPCG